MKERLCWRELDLGLATIPEARVERGEYLRIIMDAQCQYDFMARVFPSDAQLAGGTSWQMWLETESASYPVGSPEFISRVGSMIRGRGLLANLSLRENLLLPFLYRADRETLEAAADRVEAVARWLGLEATLDERAGERSSYTHALVSLGRCMLARPAIILAQEVHIGMAPERLAHFRELAAEALRELGSGLVYLTSSEHEGSGLRFSRTLTIEDGREMLAFREMARRQGLGPEQGEVR